MLFILSIIIIFLLSFFILLGCYLLLVIAGMLKKKKIEKIFRLIFIYSIFISLVYIFQYMFI